MASAATSSRCRLLGDDGADLGRVSSDCWIEEKRKVRVSGVRMAFEGKFGGEWARVLAWDGQ